MLTFLSFLSTPEGQNITRIFWDEAQEVYVGHKDRLPVYERLFDYLSTLGIQLIFVSGSLPPHLHGEFCTKAVLDPSVRVICAPTDRPELGYDILPLNPFKSGVTTWESTLRLVSQLKTQLSRKERIIVFFLSTEDAVNFAKETKCALCHANLPKTGHSKEHYLDMWDRGDSSVLAATTACGQGIDRGFVTFVVFYLGAFGLISFDQGGGRAGRRQKPSFVIVVHEQNSILKSVLPLYSIDDPHCNAAFTEYITSTDVCLRWQILATIDGEELAVDCSDSPGCNPCSFCKPDGELYVFFRYARTEPLPMISGNRRLKKSIVPHPPKPVAQ